MTYTDPTRPVTAANRQKVVDFARAQVGKPYKFAAAGPKAFDCSGLVMAAWAQAGLVLPHQSGLQAAMLKAVAASDATKAKLQPGDVVFYYGSVTEPASITHCGVFTGWQLDGGVHYRYLVAAVDDNHGVMYHWLFWALPPSGYGYVGHS